MLAAGRACCRSGCLDAQQPQPGDFGSNHLHSMLPENSPPCVATHLCKVVKAALLIIPVHILGHGQHKGGQVVQVRTVVINELRQH